MDADGRCNRLAAEGSGKVEQPQLKLDELLYTHYLVGQAAAPYAAATCADLNLLSDDVSTVTIIAQ